MQILIYAMIFVGAALMVSNIIRYFNFLMNTKDVLSSGSSRDRAWEYIALILLCFFLTGYLLVAFLGKPDLVVAGILFGGSVFVAIVLTIMFRLMKTVKDNCLSIAETLISVIDTRDPNLKGHSQHVRNLTMLLYEYLPQEKKRSINKISLEYAALMHDVGKLGIPEYIINKPSALNEEEWFVMRTHPRLGVEILNPLTSFREIFPWIEYHHERIDGKGYYKMPGSDIPYASRILTIADTYSAITMKRSYKPPKSHDEAIRIMKEVAGIQLDSELVEIFCSIPKEKLMSCAPRNIETLRLF